MEKIIIPSLLLVSDGILISDRMLKISLPLTVNDPKLLKLHTKLTSVYNRLVKNQKYSVRSPLTDRLILLGKRRNKALTAIRSIIYGMSESLIEETSKNATILYTIIKKYVVKVYSMGYKEETANLISLFSDFDLPANHALLNDLGILPFYESLKTAHFDFDALCNQKSDHKTEQIGDSEAATAILTELIPVMTNLLALLELNKEFEPEAYSEAYNQLVTYINEINAAARARKTRKQNSNEPEVKKENS